MRTFTCPAYTMPFVSATRVGVLDFALLVPVPMCEADARVAVKRKALVLLWPVLRRALQPAASVCGSA